MQLWCKANLQGRDALGSGVLAHLCGDTLHRVGRLERTHGDGEPFQRRAQAHVGIETDVVGYLDTSDGRQLAQGVQPHGPVEMAVEVAEAGRIHDDSLHACCGTVLMVTLTLG